MATRTLTVPQVDVELLKKQLKTVMALADGLPEGNTKENLVGLENLLSEMIYIGESGGHHLAAQSRKSVAPPVPAFYTPTVTVELLLRLLTVLQKSEGCVLRVIDYDAMDPEQGREELAERRATGETEIDTDGDEYQMKRWGSEDILPKGEN